jgi:hypothetical protein
VYINHHDPSEKAVQASVHWQLFPTYELSLRVCFSGVAAIR